MSATIHDFTPSPAAQALILSGSPAMHGAGVHASGPLRGLPIRGARPTLELVPTAEADDETILAAQLLLACAPGRPDRLDCCPAVKKREGFAWQALVIVDHGGLSIIASADVMRRMAVVIDSAGRRGAALDLMNAADQAEALSAHMQRGAA